jgi:predicted ester cyclase
MSTEENKDLVRRLVDAINNQSLDEPDILLDPDFRLNGEHVSLADFQEFVIWYASVLTELHISIEDIIAVGDKVVCVCYGRASIKDGSMCNRRVSPRLRAASTSSASQAAS